MSKDSEHQVIGYEYLLGVHYIFCQDGVTNLRKIKVGKDDPWTGNVTSNSQLTINDPIYFGGRPPSGSGGFSATVDVEFGGPTQGINDYLQNTMHTPDVLVPAYRKRFGLVFRRAKWGTSGGCSNVAALMTGDAGITWYTAKKWVTVVGAAYPEINPIHIIYYFLNDNRNGLGVSSSMIDETSFQAAADACYTDGLGLSFFFGGDNTVQQNLQEVMNHIDASVYQDPNDGKFKIKLTRADYDVNDLTLLDDSNSETVECHDTGFDELVNQLVVEYYDLEANRIASYVTHDLGLREAMGGYTVTKTIRYNGVNSERLAAKLAARDMLGLSRPLKRVKIRANREAIALRPGDAFLWTNDDEGVTEMVLRIRSIKRGGLKDRKIEIDAIQDVFAYGTETYDDTNPDGWIDPASIAPEDLTRVQLLETPYWFYLFKFAELPSTYDEGEGAVLILAGREHGVDEYYGMLEKLSTDASYVEFPGQGDFCPFGYLDSSGLLYDMTSGVSTVTLQETEGLDQVILGSAAWCNGEIMRVDAVNATTGVVSFGRGAADTVVRTHPANSIVWFFGYQSGYVSDGYIDGETVNIKLLPKTPYDRLEEADATAHSQVMDSRADRPYPPGKFRINGAAYPVAIMGTLVLTWTHRDRILEGSELYDEADGSIGPEAGQTYTARYYNENGTLSDTQNGIVGTTDSWIYEETDSGLGRYNNVIRVKLGSRRDGLDSFQEHDYTFDRADYGYSYGEYYGGY